MPLTKPPAENASAQSLSYRDAGVDIDAGDALVERIKPYAKRTLRPEVMADLGGFGALFKLDLSRYRQPILVSGTDGVGTKLKLAIQMAKHDTIGIDLVAMSVNDVVVQGAEPLFFLDYYATGKLRVEMAADVIKGIALGCEDAGCALIGGETAEMPGLYHDVDYDLAGFCVGIVDQDKIIDGRTVKVGDAIIGLASSGPHSNGYSLIRKILETRQADLQQPFANQTLGEVLLAPTRIYVKPLLGLFNKVTVKALAHITGGGLLENIPRVLPMHTVASLNRTAWTHPEIFTWLQRNGNVDDTEMYRTFNCGIGMVVVVDATEVDAVLQHFQACKLSAWPIGSISAGQGEPRVDIR